eukprot:13070880-Alexandrium_andersonii.AAC.1
MTLNPEPKAPIGTSKRVPEVPASLQGTLQSPESPGDRSKLFELPGSPAWNASSSSSGDGGSLYHPSLSTLGRRGSC